VRGGSRREGEREGGEGESAEKEEGVGDGENRKN